MERVDILKRYAEITGKSTIASNVALRSSRNDSGSIKDLQSCVYEMAQLLLQSREEYHELIASQRDTLKEIIPKIGMDQKKLYVLKRGDKYRTEPDIATYSSDISLAYLYTGVPNIYVTAQDECLRFETVNSRIVLTPVPLVQEC